MLRMTTASIVKDIEPGLDELFGELYKMDAVILGGFARHLASPDFQSVASDVDVYTVNNKAFEAAKDF